MSEPANQATEYGVRIVPATVVSGQRVWRAVEVEHLAPDDNRGRRNVFFTAFHADGTEARDIEIWWSWEGQHADQIAPPVKLDKPPSDEFMGDFPLDPGMVATCWVNDGTAASDKVTGLSTAHGNEFTADGQAGNYPGHHSFAVHWQEVLGGVIGQPPTPPPDPPPTDDCRTCAGDAYMARLEAKVNLLEHRLAQAFVSRAQGAPQRARRERLYAVLR